MEKWRSKGKHTIKEESVLPPTKRFSGQNCLPAEKKKDKKWSFGGLLRRISSGQHNETSSNEEDITYIPGHMLTKKQTKKVSKMKSKWGKTSGEEREPKNLFAAENFGPTESRQATESLRSSRATIDQSQDSVFRVYNDSANSPSSRGSADAMGKHSRLSRMKARAAAKRDRLCGNVSSDDESHYSSQSSMKFRSEDNIQTSVQRTDSYSRRTRGARTERYIKRMSREDCNSSSDFSNPVDVTIRRSIDSPRISSPSGSSSRVFDRSSHNFNARDDQECEKFTWPKRNVGRSNGHDEIYGCLRPRQISVVNEEQNRQILPPEPPPRSCKSRIFPNTSNPPFNDRLGTQQSCRRYYEARNPTNVRSCMSDNETPQDFRWTEVASAEFPDAYPYRNDNYYSLKHSHGLDSPVNRLKRQHREETRNHGARDRPENAMCSPSDQARTTRSLPKGVELFSRQKLANCAERGENYKVPERSRLQDSESSYHPVPKPRTRRETSQSPESKKISEENEAERKRSSRNLQEALFELEAIYNSLRLSDPDLLERAEQRTMDEYRDNAAKSIAEHSLKNLSDTSSNENHEVSHWNSQSDTNLRIGDDMAYRRMNPKERPSSVNGQSSVSRISYLATSPNLSIRENDYFRPRSSSSRRSSPDLTRDDLLFRSMSHAVNTLKVIEPQPPFGIPLGPVTGSTESDYLHAKPMSPKSGQTRSLYIPKSEPDVVCDDLAFRNLRKDKDNHVGINKNTNYYLQMDSLIEPHLPIKYDSSSFAARKKRAGRSNSADLTNNETEWYNEFVKSSQKLSFSPELRNNSNKFDFTNSSTSYDLMSNPTNYRDNLHLDINGNQPKSALQRKIQVYVPRDNFPYDNETFITDYDSKLARESRGSTLKSVTTESEDSCPERCCHSRDSSASDIRRDHDDKNMEQFTEQEISEYKQLCQDLEKLIRQTDDDETKNKDEAEENNSQSEIDEWEKLFNDDYQVPASILNFNESLEIPNIERDEDRSSSRSVGLSSENLPIFSRKLADDDLLSSASELGICSNNGSLPDSVYDKFNQLLREVNDLPPVECANKLANVPTDELDATSDQLKNNETYEQRKSSDSEIINEATIATRNLHDDTSHVLEYRAKFASPKRALEDQDLTNSLERLKSLTRRMRNEDSNNEVQDSRRNNEAELKEEQKMVGNANFHEEESSGSTDSVYDKFNQLLREVNDVPLVENPNKVGKYPTDETTSFNNPESVGSSMEQETLSLEPSKNDTGSEALTPGTWSNSSSLRDRRTKVSSPNNHSKDQRSRTSRNSELLSMQKDANESHATRNEGRIKTRPKPELDDQTFAYREGEKNIEDEPACNDNVYAFKDTSMHKFSKLCHLTNSITVCQIVLCSFFLTLLITIIFAQ